MNVGSSPFVNERGEPCLTRSALLFVDLLGVSAMTGGGDAQRNLVALDQALRSTFRDFLRPGSASAAAMFSDTLVVVEPVLGNNLEDEEVATGGLIIDAAWLQLNLATQGYFLRGALTLGLAHLHKGLLFGPALVEAYALEQRRAVHPRIVLSEAAATSQRESALQFYGDPAASPQNLLLAVDQDGTTFVDYLALVVDDEPDPQEALAAHAGVVASKLSEFRSDSRRWDKYRWTAEYHNAVCALHFPGSANL